MLLPGTDDRGGLAVKERIESLLELNNQFYTGNTLSLSLGMARADSGAQIEAAIQKADREMYAEKARYYNTVQTDRRQL